MALQATGALANSLSFFKVACLFACLPPAAASLPQECAEGGGCPDALRHVSLLQRQHDVRSPRAAESAGGGAKLVQRKPNIVLFLPDDMYLHEYSAWHPDGIGPGVPDRIPIRNKPLENSGVMPRLEKIAQSGVTFARAYTSSPSCTPSRYSIMTGRYPSRSEYGRDYWSTYFPDYSTSFVDWHSLLGDGNGDTQKTVASALVGLGYTTGMVGKWHLAPPKLLGFQDAYAKQTGLVKKSGWDFVDGLYIANMCQCSFPVCSTFSHNMEWLVDNALYFMDDAMRKELPFFLYFAATPAHLPTVQDSLLGHFGVNATPAGTALARDPNPSTFCSSCKLPLRKDIWDSATRIASRSRVGLCRASLAALLWLDASLGVLYDFLSERGAIGNTYIVISVDHGPAKMSLYELGIRVPLYAAGPGIRAGARVDEPVSHVDLAPTFLTWAGGSMPWDVDGLSWSSLASAGAGRLDREGVRAESYFDRAVVTRDLIKFYTSPTTAMIKAARLKAKGAVMIERRLAAAATNLAAIVGDSYPALYDEIQLYNLTADPLEQVNLWYYH